MKHIIIRWISWLAALCIVLIYISCSKQKHIYIYNLTQKENIEMYNEAVVVSCLQGIINRKGPKIFSELSGHRPVKYFPV
jgi:hypothetical protein